ncbi:MAG: hypothetical protein ACI4L8_05670 [Candidatus Fimadaptatus sp.]
MRRHSRKSGQSVGTNGVRRTLRLEMPLTDDGRRILLSGCLINYYKEN